MKIRLEGERTKNGEDHTIPLSVAARGMIDAFPSVTDSKFVFTTKGNTPISGWSRAKQNIDEIICSELEARKRGDDHEFTPWRIHDLRRTAATGMERLGIKQQVVEALLGHISGSKAGVTGIYQRHTYEKEKRDAIEKWVKHLTSLVGRLKCPRSCPFLMMRAAPCYGHRKAVNIVFNALNVDKEWTNAKQIPAESDARRSTYLLRTCLGPAEAAART